MLITKTVKMKWNTNTRKYYESKGYIFTKYTDELEVDIKDLQVSSNIHIEVECDGIDCNKINSLTNNNYNKILHNQNNKGNIYLCKKCFAKFFWSEKRRREVENGKSFEKWCYDNLSKGEASNILLRWDYELNEFKPSEVCFNIACEKFWFKCLEHIDHHSELKRLNTFTMEGQKGCLDCKQCKSFAQWGINNLGNDFLEKYWDYDKNININPYEIKYGCHDKVWIICQEKRYHESYKTSCNSFTRGCRCSYCAGKKVHKFDSLGYLFPKTLEIWSTKNDKTAYEYLPNSGRDVWWKCLEGHEDYYRNINTSNYVGFRCPTCNFSKGEIRIEEWLLHNGFINSDNINDCILKQNINYYKPQKEFDGLLGVKNGSLSYDFYIPNCNLLIEYQGEYHDTVIRYKKDTIETAEYNFKRQIEHDKRKKEYADENNIELLPIWYWDFDNIEEILSKNIKLK